MSEAIDRTTISSLPATEKAIRQHEKPDPNPLLSIIPGVSCLHAPPQTGTETPVPSSVGLLAGRDEHYFAAAVGFIHSGTNSNEGAARALTEPAKGQQTGPDEEGSKAKPVLVVRHG